MADTLQQFFYMHGHGVYVFSAYGCVLLFLALQWFIPWRRWRHAVQSRKNNE